MRKTENSSVATLTGEGGGGEAGSWVNCWIPHMEAPGQGRTPALGGAGLPILVLSSSCWGTREVVQPQTALRSWGHQEPFQGRPFGPRERATYLRHHGQPQQVADATYQGDEDFPTETLP